MSPHSPAPRPSPAAASALLDEAPTAVAAAPAPPKTGQLLGVDVALTDYEQTLDWIDATVAARETGYICVAATHTIMATREDPDLLTAVRAASMTVPDGQPVVWGLRGLGHTLRNRVYGPTLMDKACERAAETGQRMFLYGGRNEGALVQLTLNLRRRYPGLQIVGGYSPPFRTLAADEEADVINQIDGSGADVVWVGIGVPKQEKWMYAMRNRVQAPVLVGVGAAFDFHAGLIDQAPPALQKLGLEWAFRLSQEPRRLFKRYAKYNPLFILGFATQFTRERVLRRLAR